LRGLIEKREVSSLSSTDFSLLFASLRLDNWTGAKGIVMGLDSSVSSQVRKLESFSRRTATSDISDVVIKRD
jgi:hypothetical protein